MELQKYCDCIKENKRITNYLVELATEGRLSDVPGALGKFYSQKKFEILPPLKNLIEDMQPIINIKRCGRKLNGNWSFLGNQFKPTATFRCDSPYCAVCNSYRSYQSFSHLRYLFENEYSVEDYKFFFITFTLPNEIGGFRETYEILHKCTMNCISYLGSDSAHKDISFCSGVYGSLEIKHGAKGWHPHYHLIIAYKKDDIVDVKLDRKGKVKYLEVKKKSKNHFVTSSIELKEVFYCYLASKFPEYVKDHPGLKKNLQYDFSPIGSSIDSFREVCKYVCKTNEITNKEDLLVYIKNSYRLTKNIKRGIFKWTEEIEKRYVEYRFQRDTCNFYFVYFSPGMNISPCERMNYLTWCKKNNIENAEKLLEEGYIHKFFCVSNIELHYVDGRFVPGCLDNLSDNDKKIINHYMRC